MATGGENFSYSKGSQDIDDPVCDPCQEDGELHKAVGMCIDCQDHLCQKCFDGHKIARPFRKHKLVDKEAMLQSQASITKDKCTEKCDVHEDKVIEYYCINHSHLGCSVCITLDHSTCDRVRYIPHVAKDLTNNEEYQQVESLLMSVVSRSKKVTENNREKTRSIEKTCFEAVKKVQEFRKGIKKVLDKAETELLQQCKIIKADKTEKNVKIVDTLKTTQQELDIFMETKEIYIKSKQNCNMYTLMMKLKGKLKVAEDGIKEAEKQQLKINDQIKFIDNKETLHTMKIPETLGQLLISGTPSTARSEQTESNGKQEQLTTSNTSGTPSTARPEQTESNVRQEQPSSSITSGTSSTARPEQTESNVRQEQPSSSITSGTSSTARPEQTQSNVKQEQPTTSITSGTLSTARQEQTQSNVKQEQQTTRITSGTSSTARPEQTESKVKQEEQTTSITSGLSNTSSPEQTESNVGQEEQTTSITSGTPSTAKPEQTESNGKQEEQTTSITPGTPSTARPEQTESNVRQEEQTTSITSGTSSTARSEQTESNVRQEEQTTSITSGTSSTARPEQTESNVKQKEQTTSITSGTPSTARSEQTESTVRQEEQATSIKSGTSSTARPEQTESNVRYQKQITSTFATSSNYGAEQPKSQKVQLEMTSIRKAETKKNSRAEYIKDVSVNHKNDKQTSSISGLVVLLNNRLVTTDCLNNETVKLVDVKHAKVISCLTLSSAPYDVAMVTNCQVAITMPSDKKVAMVNVTANVLTVDRTLDVDGECFGVDYREGKLAVSFLNPEKVQVLTLQGRVLHTITIDQQGQELFNYPYYLAFGQNNTSLFVSNFLSANVVKVKFDGTVVGTYTDSELRGPTALLTDSSGHVYVCGCQSHNIHQITPDCRTVKKLLTEADGLCMHGAISYSETEGRLYVGTYVSDVIKVYRVILGSE